MDEKLMHRGESPDDEALVKAAAWAWHQHGSERKPFVKEFDATRTRHSHRPSRYRLEAVRLTMDANSTKEDDELSCLTISPSHTDNSLLDRYEIASISKRLESLIKSSSAHNVEESESGLLGGGFNMSRQNSISSDGDAFAKKKKKKKALMKWLGLRPGVVCGTNEDVEVRALIGNRQRRPRRFVPAVSVPISILRAAHAS